MNGFNRCTLLSNAVVEEVFHAGNGFIVPRAAIARFSLNSKGGHAKRSTSKRNPVHIALGFRPDAKACYLLIQAFFGNHTRLYQPATYRWTLCIREGVEQPIV